jgi:hypothetical protein
MSVSPGNAPIQRLLAARALRLGSPFASEHAVVVQRPSFGEASSAFVARLLLLQTWQPGDQIELIAEEGRIVCARQVSAVLRTDAFGGAAVAADGGEPGRWRPADPGARVPHVGLRLPRRGRSIVHHLSLLKPI